MPWYIYGIMSAILSGLTVFLAKSALKDSDPILFVFLRSFIMTLILGVIAYGAHKASVFQYINMSTLKIIFLSGLAGALSWVFFFTGLKKGTVAGIEVVDRLSIVFAILFAALFLGEAITLKSGIALVLVLAGAVLMII